VFPTTGVVQASTKQSITVEFYAESSGLFEELVGIDVSDRSPTDSDVLEYRLVGESCVPGINTTDFSSIFEEQRYKQFKLASVSDSSCSIISLALTLKMTACFTLEVL
jgi:hypothetical protein